MELLLYFLMLIVGFVFLIKGADFFIVSSSSIARKFNVSPLVIGLTLVAFGTSLPELGVSFIAAIRGSSEIAMGNVIGSNIANLTLILGFSAIMMPVAVKKSIYRQEFPFLVVITILISVLAFFFQGTDHQIVWWESIILLLFFAFYMYLMFKSQKEADVSDEIHVIDMKKAVLLLIFGLLGVSVGGFLVTSGAEYISVELLEKVFLVERTRAITLVGLSIVALGTSLPELVTSVMAAKKGENEIALGNVIGSNVFNTLLIVGLTGVVVPLKINNDVLIDTVILIFITAITIFFAFTKQKISKIEGYFLVIMYFSYIAYIIVRAIYFM
jgi:cation:H+ antiporter